MGLRCFFPLYFCMRRAALSPQLWLRLAIVAALWRAGLAVREREHGRTGAAALRVPCCLIAAFILLFPESLSKREQQLRLCLASRVDLKLVHLHTR